MEPDIILCPHGAMHEAIFVDLPEGYATSRWPAAVELGTRKEEPYVQCLACGATWPKWAIDEYLERE